MIMQIEKISEQLLKEKIDGLKYGWLLIFKK
jgi:hypothetical protein